MARSGAGKGAGRAALVGVLSALSLVFLYASALVPTGQMGVVAVAGLLVAAAVLETVGLMTYLPVLSLCGLGAGCVIGAVGGILTRRLQNIVKRT